MDMLTLFLFKYFLFISIFIFIFIYMNAFLLGGKMIFGDLMNSKPKKSTSSSSYIYSKKSFAVAK